MIKNQASKDDDKDDHWSCMKDDVANNDHKLGMRDDMVSNDHRSGMKHVVNNDHGSDMKDDMVNNRVGCNTITTVTETRNQTITRFSRIGFTSRNNSDTEEGERKIERSKNASYW